VTIINVPNPDVLRAGVAHAELHLEQWDQSMWVSDCDTTACLAGHILLAQGMTWEEIVAVDSQPGGGISKMAIKALGFDTEHPLDWAKNGRSFAGHIFGYIATGVEKVNDQGEDEYETKLMAFEPAAMKTFKDHITKVTGIEF